MVNGVGGMCMHRVVTALEITECGGVEATPTYLDLVDLFGVENVTSGYIHCEPDPSWNADTVHLTARFDSSYWTGRVATGMIG